MSSVIINGDTDLISANVKQGVNIFGVDGKTSVIDTEDTTALEADENFNNLINSTIGDAIRNKNGSTSKLTLDAMVTAINNMASVTIDNVMVSGNFNFSKSYAHSNCGSITEQSMNYIDSVGYNNEVHIFGIYYSGLNVSSHYKWDGSSFTRLTNLPYCFDGGRAIVYNDKIHILGGSTHGYDNEQRQHYEWNGTNWTKLTGLPYDFNIGKAVVYNDEIHILGGINGKNYHYKWNGTSWTAVSTIPYNFYSGGAVVLNGEIHILCSSDHPSYHYKWDGTSWTSVSSTPFASASQSFCVIDKDIYGFVEKYRHKWDGTTWTVVDNLTVSACGCTILNNDVYYFSNNDNNYLTLNVYGAIYKKVD